MLLELCAVVGLASGVAGCVFVAKELKKGAEVLVSDVKADVSAVESDVKSVVASVDGSSSPSSSPAATSTPNIK